MKALPPDLRRDPRFLRVQAVARELRPDKDEAWIAHALVRALIEKHGLIGVDENLLLPFESVMLTAAHLELKEHERPAIVQLWEALLGEKPGECGRCGGVCDQRYAECGPCQPAPLCDDCGMENPSAVRGLPCSCGCTSTHSRPRALRSER